MYTVYCIVNYTMYTMYSFCLTYLLVKSYADAGFVASFVVLQWIFLERFVHDKVRGTFSWL